MKAEDWMKSTKRERAATWTTTAAATAAAVLLSLLCCTPQARAQAAATRILGTVSAISGDTLTVKPAQGDARQIEVPSTAQLERIEPGQTNLSAAVAMQFSELAVGDRVLVNVDPNSTGATPQAVRVIAIKAEDVAKKQQDETQAWQRGAGGLVKSVDTAGGTIILSSGAGAAARTITIHVTQSTILKRYAPGSVNFAEAQAGPIAAIQPGDQLRARGQKNADGSEMTADEVVSGGFRNISGTILSLDASTSTIVVKDLATKKPVTVHMGAEVQMRKLSDRAAQFLAARLNGQAGGGRPSGGQAGGGQTGGGQSGGDQANGGGAQRGAGDPQQMLSRADVIHFSDLQKGEAVMLVSTQGASEVTAITVLAGVEPLLEAPASQDLLANWSMNSSAPEDAGQ
jgi:endonuclease YncB( thermonuclease family)